MNGAPRTQVGEVQRARLLAAAMEVVGEMGYGGMSVARVTARAGVSRRTFYDLFADREDCFLAAFDEAVGRAAAIACEAAAGERGWQEQVRAGLTGLLGFIEDEPVAGSLVVLDALSAGPKILARRAQVLKTLTAIVNAGRAERKRGHDPPPLTAEGVVGAVFAVVHARLLEGEELAGLASPLMAMIVLPYRGPAAAAKELTRLAPRTSSRARKPPAGDPLEGLDMRLTYRTLRVLAAIAGRPGASNRQVADAAGVADQGQISKLLTRLEHLGLVDNAGAGAQARGEANAWRLTAKGQDVARAIDPAAASAAPAR
jgi:AcrR family transcriptional regulator/DNA-binding MarR family transcriptional regulator